MCAVADVKALIEVDIKIALKSVTTGLLLDVAGLVKLLSALLHVRIHFPLFHYTH